MKIGGLKIPKVLSGVDMRAPSFLKPFLKIALLLAAYFLLAWFLWRIPEARAEEGFASWYSTEACHEKGKKIYTKDCLTASGKSLYALEKEKVDFAAMWKVPFGSRYKICNLANGKTVEVKIYDRGPSHRLNRLVDLGRHAFEKIADKKEGLIRVRVEVV